MELQGTVKNYDWGNIGESSIVAELAKLNISNFQVQQDLPYAELWMGNHPNGPTTLKKDGSLLGDFIKENPELNGGRDTLSFLFKVLSIRKALSIQVHPNKVQAEKLHAERPEIYKDPNHKPELAIALTPFVALIGFRPITEIRILIKDAVPLYDLIGAETFDLLVDGPGLRACFTKLMSAPQDKVSKCIEDISKSHVKLMQEFEFDEIFAEVNRDFPNDIGVLCIFLLNVIVLKPGQALFLEPNEPHAYLRGDCVECMACSDNVIRAGLTPKYKDVSTLLDTLRYGGERVETKFFGAVKRDDNLELFIPNLEDFAVAKIKIPSTQSLYKFRNSRYGSIMLVISGKRIIKSSSKPEELLVQRGSIVFIPSNYGIFTEFNSLNDNKDNNEEFVAYLALFNTFNEQS